MPLEYAFAAFGITAAIVLVGGAILLWYQRDRQHFLLMQVAMEKGITAFPGAIPGWLVSLRAGVLSLVLGVGLIGSGIALHVRADAIDKAPVVTNAGPNRENPEPRNPGPPDSRVNGEPRNPPGFGGGAGGGGPGPGPGRGPDDRPRNAGPPQGPQGRPGMGERPPPVQPEMERWYRVQTQRTTGLVAMCAGAILVMLGIVRIGFARMERRYAADMPRTGPGT